MLIKLTTLFGVAFVATVFLFGKGVESAYAPIFKIEDFASGIPRYIDSGVSNKTLLFTGDVMLSRNVESRMINFGTGYPFEGLDAILNNSAYVIGNFEGTVPKKHIKTEPMQMNFSVRSEYLGKLKEVGFNAISLSNNHALDYGENAYANTQQTCVFYNIECFGHPTNIDSYSITYTEVGDTKVSILALHTLFGDLDDIKLGLVLDEMSSSSDVQVVYIHWGIEYDLLHSTKQKVLAYKLIDNGIDVIIGQHPHVVQDIEIYKNKPIFYSLGNFIFDQYFSEDVQNGLVVTQNIYSERIEYSLIPVTSIGTKSQPNLMDDDAKETFLKELSERSDEALTYSIAKGKIVVPR